MGIRDTSDLLSRMQSVIDLHGPWTAHNIELPYNIKTVGGGVAVGFSDVAEIVSDLYSKDLRDARVLDLGCLEGGHSIEFAKRGCSVLGIEGRASNIAKAQFAKEELKLKNLSFELEDVRNLSVFKHGYFDIVICSGILYHLQSPDCFQLLERIGELCKEVLFTNTHIAQEQIPHSNSLLSSLIEVSHNDQIYRGRTYIEHTKESTAEAKEGRLWASLDNETSFWLTEESLLRVLHLQGFRHTYKCLTYWKADDRAVYISKKS